MNTFTDLLIRKSLIDTLTKKQITTPTAVQSQIIPEIMKGKNVIFSSETGTGKTYAFLLPLITMMISEIETQKKANKQPTPQPGILIVAPTNELASQLKQETDFL